jgi:hypothetical protein
MDRTVACCTIKKSKADAKPAEAKINGKLRRSPVGAMAKRESVRRKLRQLSEKSCSG